MLTQSFGDISDEFANEGNFYYILMILQTLNYIFYIADTVTAVEFDETGEHLATGDRGGRIVVFKQSTDKIRSVSNIYSNYYLKFECFYSII